MSEKEHTDAEPDDLAAAIFDRKPEGAESPFSDPDEGSRPEDLIPLRQQPSQDGRGAAGESEDPDSENQDEVDPDQYRKLKKLFDRQARELGELRKDVRLSKLEQGQRTMARQIQNPADEGAATGQSLRDEFSAYLEQAETDPKIAEAFSTDPKAGIKLITEGLRRLDQRVGNAILYRDQRISEALARLNPEVLPVQDKILELREQEPEYWQDFSDQQMAKLLRRQQAMRKGRPENSDGARTDEDMRAMAGGSGEGGATFRGNPGYGRRAALQPKAKKVDLRQDPMHRMLFGSRFLDQPDNKQGK